MGRGKEMLMEAKYSGRMEPSECDYYDEDWYNSLYAETEDDRIDECGWQTTEVSHEGLG